MSTDQPPQPPFGINPVASRQIFFGMLALVAGGMLAYNMLKGSAGPPPADIAKDPLLVRGREIYEARCVSCHGTQGRGDGAIAKNLNGPPVGNFTDATWKHGDTPEQIIKVISKGTPNSSMSAWGAVLDPPDINAVAAYVLHLAGKPVPEVLRKP